MPTDRLMGLFILNKLPEHGCRLLFGQVGQHVAIPHGEHQVVVGRCIHEEEGGNRDVFYR